MTDLLAAPVTTLDGTATTLGALTDGKAALVVNVASRCGLTPQYSEARGAARAEFADRGFTVLGFPCNQFGGQEPGTSEEIAEFCSATYGVTFPMSAKVDVNGDEPRPALHRAHRDARRRRARRATCSGTSRSSCSRRTERSWRGSVRAPNPTRPRSVRRSSSVLPAS